jgi:hypothetical protein
MAFVTWLEKRGDCRSTKEQITDTEWYNMLCKIMKATFIITTAILQLPGFEFGFRLHFASIEV